MNQPAQPADWGSKFKRWRLAKAVRVIKELERWRGQPLADAIRRCMVAIQPGIAPLRCSSRDGAEFILLVPPGWSISGRQERRLQRVLRRRQQRTGAAVVSCDDWVSLANGRRAWRQKGQFDPLLEPLPHESEGPLWIRRELLQQLGHPPTELTQRFLWRVALFEAVGAAAWAHVALPLVTAPVQDLPSVQPAQPQGDPLVSVLIPSGGFCKPIGGRSTMLLRHGLQTLLQRSEYRQLEIVLIDGGELTPRELKEFEQLTTSALGPGRWVHTRSEQPYSYSQRLNQAAEVAHGDWFLQLNDDTEVLEPGAIGSMLALAQRPGVGIVGALLLYPGGRVQHAGVAIDNLAPRHPWAGNWPKRLPYGWLAAPRPCQAVTAAVCLCSAKLWRDLDGLRSDLPINYGDVDFCLRARQQGLAVLLDPTSRWTHFESASRSIHGTPPELPRFREIWSDALGGRWCIDPYVSRWRELMAVKPR